MKNTWMHRARHGLLSGLSRRKRAGEERVSATPNRAARVVFEEFEKRMLLAQITWINAAGGAWGTAANWNLNRVPTTGDDVVIPDLGAAGANLTITYSTGSTTVNSVA